MINEVRGTLNMIIGYLDIVYCEVSVQFLILFSNGCLFSKLICKKFFIYFEYVTGQIHILLIIFSHTIVSKRHFHGDILNRVQFIAFKFYG